MSTKADVIASLQAARTVALGLSGSVVTPPAPAATLPIVSRIVERPKRDASGAWVGKSTILGAILPDLDRHPAGISIAFVDDGGRYDRWQKPIEWAGQTLTNPQGIGPTATIRAFIETTTAPQLTFGPAWTAVFTLSPFDPASPTLLGAPIVVGSVSAPANATDVRLTFDKSALVEGWYMIGITGLPAGWDYLPYPAYVRHGATALPQAYTPVIVGSYKHDKTRRLSYSLVPAKFDPIVVPTPHRDFPPITPIARVADLVGKPADVKAREMAKLAYTMLVPFKRDDVYRPSKLPSGVWTTANIQNYDASSFAQDKPRWTVLEGERGRSNLVCATALVLTHRTDTAKVVFAQPWNVGTRSDDGTIKILFGYVHDEPPLYPYWNLFSQQRPPTPIRLVGDWSAMPPTRRVPHEFWGLAIDYRTTVTDETAAPVGTPPEKPHPGDVVMYVCNTKMHNVIKATLDGKDRTVPAKLTEFAYKPGGLPWWCVTFGNLLIVSWSGVHVIEAYDMDNAGALVWSRAFTRPEGLAELGGFLYIGSRATSTVQKMDIATGATTKFCDVPTDNNSGFVNVAVAMDTFTPGVNVATVTWSGINANGWPIFWGPDGQRLAIGDRELGFGEPKGMYFPDGLSYGAAVAMNSTRTVFNTVQDGLHQLSAALPTDAVVPQIVKDGAKKMYDLDLELVYGDYFFGYGGQSARGKYGPEVDALIDNMGHA